MTQRSCGSCGATYEAQRPSSRFCSERCRKRAQRGHVVSLPSQETPQAPQVPAGGAHAATLADLSRVGREETSVGVVALILARRIDSGTDTGSAIAALAGRWQTLMAQALDGAKPTSHVDELREKRAARRGV